jgi:hypothetical protein
MHVIKLSEKRLRECPILWLFVYLAEGYPQVTPHGMTVKLDYETTTMADLWGRFTAKQREGLCHELSQYPKYKNIHQGLLALIKVTEILETLNSTPTFHQYVHIDWNLGLVSNRKIHGILTS